LVHGVGYLGKLSTYRVKIGESLIEVASPNQSRPKDGNLVIDWDDQVYLSWEASSPVVLSR